VGNGVTTSALWELTAIEAARQIRAGVISSQDLVSACIARIAETDDDIRAWRHFDPDKASADALARDELRRHGGALGALHGIPVGVKDIIDTDDMPTELGSPIHRGRAPQANAAVVDKLLEAGAVIMGKTMTTEFAFLHPADTANPHNPAHSPGGSSSGSAAAVAAGHVPLAIGSQTNGSTIRPASFCGVFGFKPTRGMISRRGLLETSRTLDQVGVFARSLEDAASLSDVLGGYDPADCMSFLRARPSSLTGARDEPPVEPNLVWFELPFADRLSPASREGLAEVLECLGARVKKFPSPRSFAGVVHHQQVIHEYEMARALQAEVDDHWDLISESLKPALQRGLARSDDEYAQALAMIETMKDFYTEVFNEYDAIVAPSAAGEAPLKEAGTGDPIFSTLWTFSGLPALSLPLLVGETGLPVGVQLVGGLEGDDKLLRTAAWFVRHLDAGADEFCDDAMQRAES
jgi:Asp-tRNA(Asn)/Glu-tRNA(Gln) amidotransferase A subunit family amidase